MVVLFLAQNIEITKFFFIKTALLKSKIITIFVKLLHFISRSLVEIKKFVKYTFKTFCILGCGTSRYVSAAVCVWIALQYFSVVSLIAQVIQAGIF